MASDFDSCPICNKARWWHLQSQAERGDDNHDFGKPVQPRDVSLTTQEFLERRSKHMKDWPTKWEAQIWQRFKKGVYKQKCERQYVIAGYILDFYFPEVRLAVELDGKQHDAAKDSQRDQHLFHSLNITTFRFPNPMSWSEVNAITSRVYAEVRYRVGRIKRGHKSYFAQVSP